MKIIKPDPFIPIYKFEKMQHPEKKLWWLAVRQKDVEGVDRLVELSHGNRETVTTIEDWAILEEVLKFFISRWPEEFKDFKEAVPQIRATRRRGGYTQNKEMMHVASLPPRFERLIKAVFPKQQFDKEFVYKLINRYQIFRIGGL